MTVKIWEKKRARRRPAPPSEEPALDLRVGKHDVLRKTVFARLENDDAILALPDTILEVLPKNIFAFRDLTIAVVRPGGHSQADREARGTNRRARARHHGPTQSLADAQSRSMRPPIRGRSRKSWRCYPAFAPTS